MTRSLKSKLTLSYIMVVVLCVLLTSILMNFFSDKYFREYVKQNQDIKNKEIVKQLSGQYSENGGWNYRMVEAIGVAALETGLIMRVKDISGDVIWDANEHNNGMCQRIIQQMALNVSERYPRVKGTYTELPYDLYSGSKKVGVVEIGSYSPYYLTDHDISFINALNTLLLGAGAVSLVLAVIVGLNMARRLSAPITKVIDSAQAIEKGNYTSRVINESNTSELTQLSTTINNLAQTLENQENLRKRLTSDVAHELRTPLATLQSHMEAMIDGIWKRDKERLISCHDEIVRINNLVGDLEKLARYEGENLILNKITFDVTELIASLVKNFEKDFLDKGIESQVLVNLLSNALKFTPEGGMVKICTEEDEYTTQISVEDNGFGIPKEDLPYIFERFYRADKSRNRLTGGSGIGLAIARSIVEAHKGTITAHSIEGRGSKFVISLPK
jgi:two-component system sensor histidine kinase BaeS